LSRSAHVGSAPTIAPEAGLFQYQIDVLHGEVIDRHAIDAGVGLDDLALFGVRSQPLLPRHLVLIGHLHP
jgi:hypothetical protein